MARNAGPDLVEHRDRRADLSRGAEAALITVVLHECGLHRMEMLRRAQAFDRRDLGALVRDRQCKARDGAPSVDEDGAGAALAVIASLLRTGQAEVLAHEVEERRARIEVELVLVAVDS